MWVPLLCQASHRFSVMWLQTLAQHNGGRFSFNVLCVLIELIPIPNLWDADYLQCYLIDGTKPQFSKQLAQGQRICIWHSEDINTNSPPSHSISKTWLLCPTRVNLKNRWLITLQIERHLKAQLGFKYPLIPARNYIMRVTNINFLVACFVSLGYLHSKKKKKMELVCLYD